MLPIKILGKDTKATLLKKEEYVEIPNNHLPYEFSLTIGDNFLDYNYEFYSPYSSLIIKAERTHLGSLMGGFYGPTTLFSMLSMISYLINVEVVRSKYISFVFKNILRILILFIISGAW